MDIRKLEAFCNVYELQNFSKAGEAMFLSQPTISSHVASLEEELGVRLFDRLGRSIIPTDAGRVLYENTVPVFEGLDRARAAIELLRDNVVGELVIGCSTIPSRTILPGMLARFSAKYPEVSYTTHTGDSADVTNHVADGAWPLGIVGQKPDMPELEAIELMQDATCVVAATDAPWLPKSSSLSMDELAQLPWILREKGSATRKTLEDGLSGTGRTVQSLNVRCRVQGTSEALAYAVAGLGVSVTSAVACKDYLQSGALIKLSVPELEGTRRFYLIRHRERQIFPALKAFLEFANAK